MSVLVRHFANKIGNRIGKRIKKISKADIQILESYDWPGNVRELENGIERAIINRRRKSILLTFLRNVNGKPMVLMTRQKTVNAPQHPSIKNEEIRNYATILIYLIPMRWITKKRYIPLLTVFLFIVSPALCQEKDTTQLSTRKIVSYGSKGFELNSLDGNYLMQIQWRGQFRLSYPRDTDPLTLTDFQEDQLNLMIRRARMKVGGHAFQPWFKYYLEYELFSANLLDFRIMMEKYPFLKLKVGQWKAQYNRERIISSGKQQTVERSIITRPFTIDRQQGLSLFGRMDGKGLADFNYWISVFMGTGRGARNNDDTHPMLMSRIQWNLTGSPLNFSGSDLKNHEKFTAIIALAGVTNQSPYTRFSQSGGGQLVGFEDGITGQYRVNQWMVETAAMLKGFSWQQEFHSKEIEDKVNREKTVLMGNLVQAGYFLHHAWNTFPENIEFYLRHAFYDPDIEGPSDLQQEFSTGLNWFIKEHLNKLTLEYSYFNYSLDTDELQKGSRVRLQWDVSF